MVVERREGPPAREVEGAKKKIVREPFQFRGFPAIRRYDIRLTSGAPARTFDMVSCLCSSDSASPEKSIIATSPNATPAAYSGHTKRSSMRPPIKYANVFCVSLILAMGRKSATPYARHDNRRCNPTKYCACHGTATRESRTSFHKFARSTQSANAIAMHVTKFAKTMQCVINLIWH